MSRTSENCQSLVAAYPAATKSSDKMRGFKRALTLYCHRRSAETGTPAYRYRAGVKRAISVAGYDTSLLAA